MMRASSLEQLPGRKLSKIDATSHSLLNYGAASGAIKVTETSIATPSVGTDTESVTTTGAVRRQKKSEMRKNMSSML